MRNGTELINLDKWTRVWVHIEKSSVGKNKIMRIRIIDKYDYVWVERIVEGSGWPGLENEIAAKILNEISQRDCVDFSRILEDVLGEKP